MADYHPTKLCECGCGQPAPIAKRTSARFGHTLGEPVRFIVGHHSRKHRHTAEGWQSPTYKSWIAMRLRCQSPTHRGYPFYGARGIVVCDNWNVFADFLADMGERPSKAHSLDRIDPNGNYEPGNCRWATRLEQGNNMRSNRLINWDGRIQTVAQWARELGLTKYTMLSRLRRWPLEKAMTEPLWQPPTHCPRGHARTPENLYVFVDGRGRTRRVCKTCTAINNARHRSG